MGGTWEEGFFLGKYWRTRATIVVASEGIRRASRIRRAGAYRGWDVDGLEEIGGLLCTWSLGVEVQLGDLRFRFLTEEEKQSGRSEVHEGEKNIYRMQL